MMRGGGYGLIGDIVVGLIGAFIGGVLAGLLGLGSFGLIGTIVVAFIGACVLIAILHAVSRGGASRGWRRRSKRVRNPVRPGLSLRVCSSSTVPYVRIA